MTTTEGASGMLSRLPSTMRVVELAGLGDASVLRESTRPVPSPEPGQLLVRVGATGVCGHDVLARRGKLAAVVGDVLGHEIAGTVVAVREPADAGADQLRATWLGRRVALVQRIPCGECAECASGATSQCRQGPGFYGEDLTGGYAEYVISSPLNSVLLPDNVPEASAAVLSCAVGTGLHALRNAQLRPDDVVVVTGAGGGVGVHTVQLAARMGHHVVAVTSSPDKVARLERLGAERVLVSPERAELRQAAAALGRPRGADAVIEVTGGPFFELSLRSLAPRGRLVLVGNVEAAPLRLEPGLVIVKELQVKGSAHGTRADLEEVVAMVSDGRLTPVSSRIWPLAAVSEAHAALDGRQVTGRAVVVP